MSLQLTEELKKIKQVDWQEWVIESRVKRHITQRRSRELLSGLKVAGEMRILDVGCSFGHKLCLLAKSGAEAFGVDIDDSLLEVGLKLAQANQVQVKFFRANAKRLPFANGTFDIVICSELIEHVKDWQKLIEEISRVAKGDGQILISSPNTRSLAIVKTLLIKSHLLYIGKGYERFLAPGKIRRELRNNGLIIQREKKANFAFSYCPDRFYKLVLWLERLTTPLEKRWGATIIFYCRKSRSLDSANEAKALDKILACPLCLGAAQEEKDYIFCLNCFKKYPIRKGIPIMLVDEAESRDLR